ncbi:MAG: F0F1 ATP synthase subunit epsilon [Deltaproteobacteria bacterium]|nr:F0F1 ATP synthase subunit epsilon [Deltaproteobacteria bacterium]RKX60456.1 MAG: F0F1 ATP synthase subunit epsilon [Thermodesulfobacteriota bacterium]MBW1946535.1 F0F1 ATP synthase subunit epsilon [Deltaproteobacteria bacterium]MBW1966590.1 F0F1 ATP synthase subunit epsilon [Deltaproteobacteria bacterium]MBW2097670.1 F0F1 ATP synthase subunit epsilon [Deltaproteobacteria bacterium]
MANKILLEVVTPSKLVVSEEVELVTAPGGEGVFGVMANHAPLLTTIRIGELHYTNDGNMVRLALSGGFCDVSKNRMTVLAESAEISTEIDVERALRAKERAERRLQEAEARKGEIDLARARAALFRALVRLHVGGHQA